MKFLQKYKLFEADANIDKAVSEIRALLYSITDEGYTVAPLKYIDKTKTGIIIEIVCDSSENVAKLNKSEEFGEFKDRLKDLGYSLGFTVDQMKTFTKTAPVPPANRRTTGVVVPIRCNFKGKVIDYIRKGKKYFNGDSDKDIYKGQYDWPNGFLLIKATDNFNVYLSLDSKNRDRNYIIVYKSDLFNDKSKIRCIGLQYIEKSEGEFIIFDNYRQFIGRSRSATNFDLSEIEKELMLDGKTFKTFNDAWYFIEDDYLEYKYPSDWRSRHI